MQYPSVGLRRRQVIRRQPHVKRDTCIQFLKGPRRPSGETSAPQFRHVHPCQVTCRASRSTTVHISPVRVAPSTSAAGPARSFGVTAGPVEKLFAQFGPRQPVPCHDENGVVAGDGSHNVAQTGLVYHAGEELGCSRWCPQDREVTGVVGAGEKLLQQPSPTGRTAVSPPSAALPLRRGGRRRPGWSRCPAP